MMSKVSKVEESGDGIMQKQDENLRIEYIDLFRGFGILLMVMGHIEFAPRFDHFIHAFHMPMFFFVSGYFFNGKKEATVFMKKKIKSLLLPYIFFGTLYATYQTFW